MQRGADHAAPIAAVSRFYRLWLAAKEYEPFTKPEIVYPTDVFIDPADALIESRPICNRE
ncbi:hypothetical protein RB620_11295 [Paenibacillus sp. LHD-117]|uniref:hypothetical protein n=1 Tax=Paenibacillus sp. LHD-117 TaxID=3071412 RepID=UPI0027DF9BF9|nr:hypothetical protein [Paenibacillus sp. LHD-117]MDQ6420020.1 hypothetical protein [Paenibacillus sp. LHD-117]